MTSKIHGNPQSVIARDSLLAMAEGGDYFKVCNPTPGTAIAAGIQTSFSATANVLMVAVNTTATRLVIPHYLRLICTVAPASATSSHMAIIADTIDRYSALGDDVTGSIKNARTDDTSTSALTKLRFGIVTAAAASAPRVLSRIAIKTQTAPAITVGDEILINFSARGETSPGLISGAAAIGIQKNVGPIVLAGANHSLLFHMWNPANAATGPSFEFEFGFWERPVAG